ncbi:hypothetical protein BKA66DRAFT_413227 [Pyrenochaeta sp. MPI-SDFR-AT-0127]|nr:hypothetical protein BKA66DRAFT_413227 [Pyrenochaeta sp. MPI-SDFR-AT-0127]
MGNHHSTANQNRLSKPKTNTNSPSPSLQIDSPISASSRYADLSAKGRQQIKETLLSPTDTDFGSAVWSNKDDDLGEPSTQTRGRSLSVTSRSNSRTNSRSNSLSCFGSKHGSTTKLPGMSDSRISLGSTAQVDLEAAIKLLQEVKRNASPEDLAALHEALELSEGSAATPTEQGLSRRNSLMDRSSSLTRRRSLLQTPGVATRTAPVEGRRRTWNSWKAPKLEPKEEAKWRLTSKGAPTSSRLTALDLIEGDRGTSTPRAQTPGEMDYSHLGNLRLGSLVVTNGAASPASSVKITKQSSHQAEEEDYFSTAEVGSSPLVMKTTRRRGHAKSKSSVLPITAAMHSDLATTNRELAKAKPIQDHLSANSKGRSFDARPEQEPPKNLRISTQNTDILAHDANRLAQSYQAYIPFSPFRATTEGHNDEYGNLLGSMEKTSEEEIYELDGTSLIKPAYEVVSTSPGLSSPAQRSAAPEVQSSKPSQRPPPRTADSGYSSGGSLRLTNREQIKDIRPVTSTTRNSSPLKRDSAKSEESDSSDQLAQSVPLVEHELPSSTTVHAKPSQRPSSLKIRDLSARSSARFSTSETIPSPQTPRSIGSNASFESTSSAAQKRLQRKRQSQTERPVVQSCQPILEGTIPDVPDSVRANFSRRLSHTPGMECLTHTYPTTEHVLAAEPALDTPSTAAVRNSQLTELEPDRPPTPPVHDRRRSFSLFRRKSTVENKDPNREGETAPIDVLDLGTIASALGQSPYDAAMSGPLRKTVTSPTHPHQLGNRLPRAKSMVSMDSEFAAEVARMRSKDRALAEREMPTKHTRDVPTVSARLLVQQRRSYHNLKMEAGEAKALKRRPKSFYQDMPPVPSINMARVSTQHTLVPSHRKTTSAINHNVRTSEHGQVVSQLVGKYGHDGQPLSQDTRSQRRQSTGENLRARNELAEASAFTINSRMMSQPPENMAAWGRYSGGLAYNYEGRGVGIGGSAGTRQLHSVASNKSLNWRNQYGVDLTDVPVMLQRV